MAQSGFTQILFAICVGEVAPSVLAEFLIYHRVATGEFRIGLLEVNQSRIRIKRFSQTEGHHLLVHHNSSSLAIQMVVVK